MRVDAHQHFWSINRGDYGWLTPALPKLFRNFGPGDLKPLIASAGIEATVLVQAAPTIAETDYILAIADATDFVAGVVGWIDFEDGAHRVELARLAKSAKFVGVRPMIQDIADVDWMLGPSIDWAYRALIDLDLAFDALGFSRHIDNFLRLMDRHPDLRVVLDHALKPQIASGAFDDWAAGISRLAAQTPAVCKLSGLISEAGPDWSVERLRPCVAHVLDAFGSDRVMWGSDWPVLANTASYAAWVQTAEALVANSFADAQDIERIFGGNASAFYKLKVPG